MTMWLKDHKESLLTNNLTAHLLQVLKLKSFRKRQREAFQSQVIQQKP